MKLVVGIIFMMFISTSDIAHGVSSSLFVQILA
jgi:hypothetical protein